ALACRSAAAPATVVPREPPRDVERWEPSTTPAAGPLSLAQRAGSFSSAPFAGDAAPRAARARSTSLLGFREVPSSDPRAMRLGGPAAKAALGIQLFSMP